MFGSRKFIGLMSGTSCDGVDGALVEIVGVGLDMRVECVEHCTTPYPEALRNELLTVMAPAKTRTEYLARLNVDVGQTFALCARQLLEQAGIRPNELTAIGSHGQTICHMPRSGEREIGFTLQIGEAAVIAAETGVTVVADFRAADLALGGQGAPLVPWTDFVLFRSETQPRIVQNIGGIANLTFIPPQAGPQSVIAFDTGPGCMVIDALIQRLSREERRYDPQGQYAARGQPDEDCVNKMMQLPYFQARPPKSAGREQFGRSFVKGMREMMGRLGLSKYDRLATATLLTARSITHAYRTQLSIDPRSVEVILCGGGARNKTLVRMLQQELPETPLKTTDDFGIPLLAKECVSFAMLGAARLDNVPTNLPQVTGASRPALLGKIVKV